MIIPLVLFYHCFHTDKVKFKVSSDEISIVELKKMIKTKIHDGLIYNVYTIDENNNKILKNNNDIITKIMLAKNQKLYVQINFNDFTNCNSIR